MRIHSAYLAAALAVYNSAITAAVQVSDSKLALRASATGPDSSNLSTLEDARILRVRPNSTLPTRAQDTVHRKATSHHSKDASTYSVDGAEEDGSTQHGDANESLQLSAKHKAGKRTRRAKRHGKDKDKTEALYGEDATSDADEVTETDSLMSEDEGSEQGLHKNGGRAPLPYRSEGCFDAANNSEARDAACEGNYVCARDGFDSRSFGCQDSHCCAFNEDRPDGTTACDSWCNNHRHASLPWRGKRCDWSRCAACDDCSHPKPQQSEVFMRYMPKHHMVVCGCGKCGTTSMYQHIYGQVFGHEWNFSGPPYAQNVNSDRWQGMFETIDDEQTQQGKMSDAFSFALIRDPKERLISAWKSKITCENNPTVDKRDRGRMVHVLESFLPIAQRQNVSCMSLEVFLETLNSIHDMGFAQFLDKHFLPQDLGCFYRFPPSRWSAVINIESHNPFSRLSKHLGTKERPAVAHASRILTNVSIRSTRLLRKLTRDEYSLLAPYLMTGSEFTTSGARTTSRRNQRHQRLEKRAHAIGSHQAKHNKARRVRKIK